MKKKKYLRAAVILFILSIAASIYSLQAAGIFNRNKILVRAISCDDCAQYEVVIGNSKISSQLQGPADSVNVYQLYLTGEPNPGSADYTKTYDYYVITGKVTALQKAKNNGMLFPVVTAYNWETFAPLNEWISISLALLFLIISVRFFIKFRFANRPDITAAVLKTHSDPPLKKI